MPDSPSAVRPVALPALYAHDTVAKAFATGIGAALAPAEDRLDRLHEVFDPWQAPPAFLDWLARLTGARTEPDWTERQRRAAIALAPWLAAHRGTPRALRREAKEIYGWDLDIAEPGGVFTGEQRPPEGRMLTVTLKARQGEDRATLTHRLTRLVLAHRPAHLPFQVVVTPPPG
ncbi:phage tail protein [Streptomyces cinnamoneus]|uniref:Tail protein n=1 Tax=Streptomyces cinnamoneus TaxID=53446 RepID=A0A918WG47_STRCJ|nr:phage tail protein [Streptomyces cinnamoneus]GHC44361.1 tail protein [Streptomyces cinnamoneus]